MEYFDTLSVYDRLSKSGLPDTTSRELSEILRETLKQQLSDMATKRDIEGLRRDIEELGLSTNKDIEGLGTATQRDIEGLRRDIEELGLSTNKDIEGLRTATQRDIEGLRRDIEELGLSTKKDIEGLRTATQRDIEGLGTATQQDIESLRKDIKADLAQMQVSLIKWNIGMCLTLIGAAIAIVKLF
ncbi:MAG: DUF1640 domain-containing protein [Deltaproteobacteria bacterium]|nr:DUF1640 domain-containing protein [Deltaproteobacteria bacterium]